MDRETCQNCHTRTAIMDYKAKNVVAEKVVQAVPPGEKQPGDQGICAAVRDFDIGRTEGALRRAAKR
jgi:hypothetical protein